MVINENYFFRQATLKICGHLDIEKAMFQCLEYLSNIIPADLMILEIYEPDTESLRILATATRAKYKKTDIPVPINDSARPVLRKIYHKYKLSGHSDAVVINDPDLDPVAGLMVKKLTDTELSLLRMTLEAGKRSLYNITIAAKGKNSFSGEDARLFSLLKESFSVALSNTLKHRELIRQKDFLADDNRFLHHQLNDLAEVQIIGADFGLKHIMERVHQVAKHIGPVLLTGESGTGKSIIANAIHVSSLRKNKPFIRVNCCAIPDNLLDSELFGFEKGFIQGESKPARGRFERANGGTIFLDGIEKLPPLTQIRLIRVFRNREIERVGGTRKIPVDIKIIAATDKNIEKMVASGLFREDLWARFTVTPIQLPPLRERKEDIPAFIRYFIDKKSKELKLETPPVPAAGEIQKLTRYHWPGNLREMENMIEQAIILCNNSPLVFNHLNDLQKTEEKTSETDKKQVLPQFDQMVSEYILKALTLTNGKISGEKGAAGLTGINPSTLRSKIKKLGIRFKKQKNPKTVSS